MLIKLLYLSPRSFPDHALATPCAADPVPQAPTSPTPPPERSGPRGLPPSPDVGPLSEGSRSEGRVARAVAGGVWAAWASSGGGSEKEATTASNSFTEPTDSWQGEGGGSRNSSARFVAPTGTMRSTPRRIHTTHTTPRRAFLVTPRRGSSRPWKGCVGSVTRTVSAASGVTSMGASY